MKKAIYGLYLWCNIVWSTTKCACLPSIFNIFFTHSKICNFDVSIPVHHDIVKLQIPDENKITYNLTTEFSDNVKYLSACAKWHQIDEWYNTSVARWVF